MFVYPSVNVPRRSSPSSAIATVASRVGGRAPARAREADRSDGTEGKPTQRTEFTQREAVPTEEELRARYEELRASLDRALGQSSGKSESEERG
jgi:hypothetical protein